MACGLLGVGGVIAGSLFAGCGGAEEPPIAILEKLPGN